MRRSSRLLSAAVAAGAARAASYEPGRVGLEAAALSRKPTRMAHRCSKRTGRGIDRRSAVQEQS